ncbi:MAG: hypothetical protein HY303_07940 [Candidatus Wallbacteria bacterium]|nr:hypothetical protein [Candidatus Wallbacteria bacterium]
MKRMLDFALAGLAVAVLLLGPGAGTGWCKGEGIVTFEDLRSANDKAIDPTDSTTGSSVLELYRKQYGKPDAATTDADFDAFLTYQASISEFLMKPELHKSAEDNFNKLIRDGKEEPNLYYVSTWAATSTTMFDNSGDIRATRKEMGDPKLGLTGKQMYFPSEEALAKILDITKQTQEAAKEVSNSDPRTLETFLTRKDELEKQLLKVIAGELAKMRDLAGKSDIYGLGYVEKENERIPVKLDMDMLKQFMAERGIEIPAPAGAKSLGKDTPVNLDAPVVKVRQSSEAKADMDSSYDGLMQPLSEHERTKREVEGDLFRIRGRPADTQKGEGTKTYDPFMTFEFQTGGLCLPSKPQKLDEE